MFRNIALVGILLLASLPARGELRVWCEHSTVKIAESAKAQANSKTSVEIVAARGEVGAFQIAFRSDVGGKVLSAQAHGLPNVSIWQEHYIDTSKGRFPDGLTPLASVDLSKDTTQPIFAEFEVPCDAKPGTYNGAIDFVTAWQAVTIHVKLTILDFELPTKPSLRTAFGIDANSIRAMEQPKDESDFKRLSKAYYEILLAHRISPYNIPADLNNPEESDAYLNDPRMTSFTIPYPDDDAALKALCDRLRANGSFKKGYFYVVDEPSTQDAFDRLDKASERLKRVVGPDYKLISPYCANPQFKTDKDVYDYLSGRVTLWCYVTSMQTYKPEKLETRRKLGEEIWNYVAWVPLEPFANFQIQQPAMHNRMLFWQEWKYNVAGVLYWGTNYWSNDAGGTKDPWHDMATVKWASKDVFGDGSLLYPGKPVGQSGPMPSLRLKLIRQGLQDYEYIHLAALKAGKEQVDAIVNGQVTDWRKYQQDPIGLDQAKSELAKLINP